MRLLATFLRLTALLTGFGAAAQTIGPDASFGTGGIVTTRFAAGTSANPRGVVVQPDQKIVTAGTTSPTYDFVAARYLPGGLPDPAFGVGGVQVINFGFSYEECFALAVQPADGKLLLGGQANGDYALLRLLPNGQPDPAFDGDGRVQLSFGVGNGSCVTQLLVQPDGKIVATGFAYSGTSFDFAAARFLPNGAPDATFGTGGRQLVPVGADRDQGRAGLLQPDGKIVIVGDTYDATGNPRFGLCRLTAGGLPDATFGTGGLVVSTLVPGSRNMPTCVVRQPDGKLVVGGEAAGDMAVARYSATGVLDPTFGTGGYRTADFSGGSQDNAYAIALQPNGKILLAGSSFTTRPGGFYDTNVVRYTAAGALDATFGTGGSLVTLVGSYASQFTGLAVQADGKPVLAGTFLDVQGGDIGFGLLRLTSAGVTGVAADAAAATAGVTVFPNPLTPASVVRFTLPAPTRVTVEVLDALGRRVAGQPAAEPLAAGLHTLPLGLPEALAPGAYVVRFTAGPQVLTCRVVR